MIGECGGISLAVEGHAQASDFAYRNVGSGEELADGYLRLVEQIPDDVRVSSGRSSPTSRAS